MSICIHAGATYEKITAHICYGELTILGTLIFSRRIIFLATVRKCIPFHITRFA
jgi:hypothetical protein